MTRSPACTRTARRAALESAQFCGDLVVAFRKVWKREVAGGAGFRCAVCDTPNRHANAWQRGTGLVGDRAGHLSRGLCACGSRRAQQRQDRGDQQIHASHAKMYIIPFSRATTCRGRYCVIGARRSVGRRFRCAALAGLLVLGAASSEAQPAVRQVLVLQSFDRGNLILDHFTGNFRVELDQRAGRPVNVVQVVVGPTGFVGAPEQAVVDYIRSTFADRPKPDLIVTVAGPAAVFARKYRQQLFPDTPLLFAAVDQRYLRRRAAWRERDRRRGRQRLSSARRRHPAAAARRPGRCSW